MICDTERLRIQRFSLDDTAFIIQLLNQRSFIDNIADKGVRTEQDAVNYLESGPISSYKEFGFGLSMIKLESSDEPVGMCGLLKRPELAYPDIGYAMLDTFVGKGYAEEAARGVIKKAISGHSLFRLSAVTSPDNSRSIGLLQKIGFRLEGVIELYNEKTNYYLLDLTK
ncbi:MAG: GNAT family N-acetyltransferase [Kangiellaceae bacterium]|nr:GNAT family N-acetyltransferase [Kangiellaceae bacterium]